MQRGEVMHAKRARQLSQNQIQEIVMDSDDEKYYASADTEDKEEPRSPSRQSTSSQPPSPDFPTATLKMRMMMVMWQVISYHIISYIFILWIRTGLQNPYGYGNSHICLRSQEEYSV